jgi:hypothetical protein
LGDGDAMRRLVTVVVEAQAQLPPLHDVPTGAHETPHAPQLLGSVSMVWGDTQALPHNCDVAGQAHAPEVQAAPLGQSDETLQTSVLGPRHAKEQLGALCPGSRQHTPGVELRAVPAPGHPTCKSAVPKAPSASAMTVVNPEAALTVLATPGPEKLSSVP